MNKKVVYTVICGDYALPILRYKAKGWDYVCITTSDIKTDEWKVIKVPSGNMPDYLSSRYYKTHPFDILKGYNLYMYIDSKVVIHGDINTYVKLLSKDKDFLITNHPSGKNTKHEMVRVLEKNKCPKYEVDDISKFYERVYFNTEQGGMYQGWCLLFRDSEYVHALFNMWWIMIENYCRRDQLSFPYTLSLIGRDKFKVVSQRVVYRYFNKK